MGTAMIAAQLVTFFMIRFIRFACTDKLVSITDGHQVAQRLSPLAGTQHVVVHISAVRQQEVVDDVEVGAHEGVDNLPHGQDHATEPNQ